MPGGPRPSSVHGTSVAGSLEQSVTTTFTSWTEDMESNPDLYAPGNPQLGQTHAQDNTECGQGHSARALADVCGRAHTIAGAPAPMQCMNETQLFQECVKNTGGDTAPCQAYLDMMWHIKRERTRDFAIESQRQAGRAFEHTWHAFDSVVAAARPQPARLQPSRPQPARQTPHPVDLEHGEPRRRSAHLQDRGPDWETMLPNIPENLQVPSHSTDSLRAIIARFNSLETMNGAVGVLLKASAVGLAYANVPISMIIFTSRPLTALLTRWPMMVFMLGYAITIFYPGIIGVRSAIRGTSIPVRWIKVHDVKVYESLFPDLRWGRVRKDTRLTLAAAGIYDNSLNRALIPGCNTTLGENSFEMQCTENVLMQGIWLQAVGATKRATKRANPDYSRPFYDYAGIQYAYTIGRVQDDGAVRAERIPAEDDIYNVMGTGEKIRGSIWDVRPSQMSSDGLFQLPFAAARGGDSGRVLSGGSGPGLLVHPIFESVCYCMFGKNSEKYWRLCFF